MHILIDNLLYSLDVIIPPAFCYTFCGGIENRVHTNGIANYNSVDNLLCYHQCYPKIIYAYIVHMMSLDIDMHE